MSHPVIERLCKENAGINFVDATAAVVGGHDLFESGNRSYGKNVYVATRAGPTDLQRSSIASGRRLADGYREDFPHCHLSCTEGRGVLSVALYDNSTGQCISQVLECESVGRDGGDEYGFLWWGPVEDVCTPWSDNDPPQCQVITVQRLRDFAQKYEGSEKSTASGKRQRGTSNSTARKTRKKK